MIPFDNSAIPLSFVAGPAVLANVCATRHAHSVDDWRSLQSLRAGEDGKAVGLCSHVDAAIALSSRRVRLQLRATELLTLGTCTFGVTSLLSLGWSMLAKADADRSVVLFATATVFAACLGLLLLMTAAITVVEESASARRMMRRHAPNAGENTPAVGGQP